MTAVSRAKIQLAMLEAALAEGRFDAAIDHLVQAVRYVSAAAVLLEEEAEAISARVGRAQVGLGLAIARAVTDRPKEGRA